MADQIDNESFWTVIQDSEHKFEIKWSLHETAMNTVDSLISFEIELVDENWLAASFTEESATDMSELDHVILWSGLDHSMRNIDKTDRQSDESFGQIIKNAVHQNGNSTTFETTF